MAHIFMQHQVADYDAWRPIFDSDASNRAAAGVTDIAVLRDVADPNSIWTVYDADPALIEPMMSDPARRADAGRRRHQRTTGVGRLTRCQLSLWWPAITVLLDDELIERVRESPRVRYRLSTTGKPSHSAVRIAPAL